MTKAKARCECIFEVRQKKRKEKKETSFLKKNNEGHTLGSKEMFMFAQDKTPKDLLELKKNTL